jgi:hypothetical protein
MQVRVVYFDGCPSWQIAVERLQDALHLIGDSGTAIELVRVASTTDAAAAGFAGSPTLLVDGQDLFSDTAPITELVCRVYPTPQGLRGSPTLEALVAALTERGARGAALCRPTG